MLPQLPQRLKTSERRLLKLFAGLTEADRATLLAFAEFLSTRLAPAAETPLAKPTLLPRPEKESVVGAIKRLAASYPMLDRAQMLNETSSLMAQHVVHGRTAAQVIDELEQMFRRHYDAASQGEAPQGGTGS